MTWLIEQRVHDMRGCAAIVDAFSMHARKDELPIDTDEALRIVAEKMREIAENMEVRDTCRDISADSSIQFYCSVCECTVDIPLLLGELNYCPNCGSKVVEGAEPWQGVRANETRAAAIIGAATAKRV